MRDLNLEKLALEAFTFLLLVSGVYGYLKMSNLDWLKECPKTSQSGVSLWEQQRYESSKCVKLRNYSKKNLVAGLTYLAVVLVLTEVKVSTKLGRARNKALWRILAYLPTLLCLILVLPFLSLLSKHPLADQAEYIYRNLLVWVPLLSGLSIFYLKSRGSEITYQTSMLLAVLVFILSSALIIILNMLTIFL